MPQHDLIDCTAVNGLTNGSLQNGTAQHEAPSSNSPGVHPIAIVGIGCRLPGYCHSPDQLWKLLIEGRSGHCEVPTSRWNADAFYHPNVDRPGSINSTGGYFIKEEDIRNFDNSFFGINNLEATFMDPQQRKLLEVVYESFESAGIPLEKIYGTTTGVYVGNFSTDYMLAQYNNAEFASRYTAGGAGPTVLSNRISYIFNLRGPSVVLDTACSSALYALHSACSAINSNECDAAVVAASNLLQSPDMQQIASKAGILSGTSICHTFDESADGYGRAEGVNAVLIKRLSDAVRDGDPIRAVIRGSAVNSNGKTSGISLPSATGQEAVIRKAYERAGLSTDCTDYVEAHGTGTTVGDPIEIDALAKVFKHHTSRPTLVGSVKTNLGHSEAASGLTSVIKVALALERGEIPPTIGVKRLNPSLKTKERNVEIVTQLRTWPDSTVARASINSFGFGGANSHVILESAITNTPNGYMTPVQEKQVNGVAVEGAVVLPLSAHSSKGLQNMAEQLINHIKSRLDIWNLKDFGFVQATRRSNLARKGYILADSKAILDGFCLSSLHEQQPNHDKLSLAFVFTGQGAQWPQMGSQLVLQYPTFRRTLDDLDGYLSNLGIHAPHWSIKSLLLQIEDSSSIHKAQCAQTICTAVQVALVDLLGEWGIHPQAVTGHSSGEIAAAYAAGRLTPRQAIVSAYLRGTVISRSSETGAMIVASLEPSAAQALITSKNLDSTVRLACINSPESVTLSGDVESIEVVLSDLQSQGTFARKLKTDGKAYHSHHMARLGQEYEDLLAAMWDDDFNASSLRPVTGVLMISSVLGKRLDPDWMASPAYWRANLVSPVLFESAISVLLNQKSHIIEIGPHSALELPIKQTAAAHFDGARIYIYTPSLLRDKDSVQTTLHAAGVLYLCGHAPDFTKVNGTHNVTSRKVRQIVSQLPTYPWDYEQPLWTEPRAMTEYRERKFPRHELLGSRVPGLNKTTMIWRNVLSLSETPWIKDHSIGSTILFPATGFIAMAIEAIRQAGEIVDITSFPGAELKDLQIMRAIVLSEEKPQVELITEMKPLKLSSVTDSRRWWTFETTSVEDKVTTVHATASVALRTDVKPLSRELKPEAVKMEQQATRVWYDRLKKVGVNWGPSFAVMQEIECDRSKRSPQALSQMLLIPPTQAPTPGSENDYPVHPITMDGMLQTALVASTAGHVENLRGKIPVTMQHVYVGPYATVTSKSNARWKTQAYAKPVGAGTINVDCELYDTDQKVLVQMKNVRCIDFEHRGDGDRQDRNPLMRVNWKPDVEALRPGENEPFSKYLKWFASQIKEDVDPEVKYICGGLDLFAHKDPNLRILEICSSDSNTSTAAYWHVLQASSPLKRCRSYTTCTIRSDSTALYQELLGAQSQAIEKSAESLEPKEKQFDVVLIPSTFDLDSAKIEALSENLSILWAGKRINVARFSSLQNTEPVRGTGELCPNIGMIWRKPLLRKDSEMRNRSVILITGQGPHELDSVFHSVLSAALATIVERVELSSIGSAAIPPRSIVISTVELVQPVLADLSDMQMASLKTITDNASHLLWVTSAGLADGLNPALSPIMGFARVLMLEQPSLRFGVYDIDNLDSDSKATGQNLVYVVQSMIRNANPDFEFVQRDLAVHVSRFGPAEDLNRRFLSKQNAEPMGMVLRNAGRYKLEVKQPGQHDSLCYKQQRFIDGKLAPDSVEIDVKSIGLNAKDVYFVNGKADTKDSTCSCECSGIVQEIGSNVTRFRKGDRVVALAPTSFSNIERVPEWACFKLRDDESLQVMSTIPLAFSTAIYALDDLARARSGETILIHSATGGVGIAAIHKAKSIGMKIFATVGSDEKRDFLIEQLRLEKDHIFSSHKSEFLPGVLSRTEGRGVDVVLNSLTSELLHESWRAVADFGRFIEIGKRDILENGRLEMNVFDKGVSFSALDLSRFYYSGRPEHHRLWQSLISRSFDFIRSTKTELIQPLQTFPAGKVTQAFRRFSAKDRIGKIAVSFEDQDQELEVIPTKFEYQFSSRKAYFLVGCLGGLGRSISRLMLSRGAKHFIFLGRSGTDRPAARSLVQDLEADGAHVDVVRGDVSDSESVRKAIHGSKLPIGGVIQAAMSLGETIWTSMSGNGWRACMDPKIKGTWNIHNSLDGHGDDLDFFLMTSSIAGSVGTATSSNYCSANAFLDAFARYRNRLGLPAHSIGFGRISEVGYLHEHPEIEAILQRKGIHSMTEDEMLQAFDLALMHPYQSPTNADARAYDSLASAHFLTGLEFVGLEELRQKGFEGNNHTLDDPRVSLFAAAFYRSSSHLTPDRDPSSGAMPEEVVKAKQDGNVSSLYAAVQAVIAKKIANLMLLSLDKLTSGTKLADFGPDSMLAAEFRGYVFKALDVDIPFLAFLDASITLGGMTDMIVNQMKG